MSRSRLGERLRELHFVVRRAPLYTFLAGTLFTAILQVAFDYQGALIVVVISVIGLIALMLKYFVYDVLVAGPSDFVRDIEPRPGLVVIASAGRFETSPALAAIKYHFRGENDERPEPTLTYLWIIHSSQVETKPEPPFLSSYDIAMALERKYSLLLGGKKHVFLHEIADPDDPYEVFLAAQAVYSRATSKLHLRPNELVADITGGTKSMTIGLALAGIPTSRDLQFMKPRAYTPDGRYDEREGSYPLLIDVNFVERRGYFPDTR